MGIMDLFRRKPEVETRAAQPGYTAAIMAARESWISGASGLAELTAAVQTCVSLWETGLSLADVTGTDLLDRRTMAITARALALRGEAVFLIRDRLIPATDWDVTTRNGIPRAYRLGIPEIGGGRRETVLAPEVLHFCIGCDGSTPWAGRSFQRNCCKRSKPPCATCSRTHRLAARLSRFPRAARTIWRRCVQAFAAGAGRLW